MKPSFVSKLTDAGIHSYVHTINDAELVQSYFDAGVTGVLTDFVTPADIAG